MNSNPLFAGLDQPQISESSGTDKGFIPAVRPTGYSPSINMPVRTPYIGTALLPNMYFWEYIRLCARRTACLHPKNAGHELRIAAKVQCGSELSKPDLADHTGQRTWSVGNPCRGQKPQGKICFCIMIKALNCIDIGHECRTTILKHSTMYLMQFFA